MNVESWMKTLAAQGEDGPPLIEASVVFWKAELRRRVELRERALAPLRRMEWAACAALVVVAVALRF